MNKRYRIALFFFVAVGIALAMLPAHLSAQKSDRAKVLGRKLMCMCGCGQILTECNHINCPSSGPMLKELDQHVAAGEADSLVIQDFVQEYGEKVLSEPPSTGFNSLAWYIPGAAFALGLGSGLYGCVVGYLTPERRPRPVHRANNGRDKEDRW